MAKRKVDSVFWRLITTLFFCLMGFAALEIGQQLINLGVLFSVMTTWWSVVILMVVLAVTGIILVWMPGFDKVLSWFLKFHEEYWIKNKWFLGGLVLVLAFGFSTWVLYWGYVVLNGFIVRICLYMVVSFIGMTLLKPIMPNENWKVALASSMLVIAVIYHVMVFSSSLSTSPFSMGWSEGSRYYYGSLYFSERLYGQDLALSPLHPSRYMLLALPFIFPGLPIWFHRLWQVFLWLGLAGWAGYLLVKRLKIQNRILVVTAALGVFLYLNLGPVYYHLMICVILIYWGVDFDKPGKTLAVLILASIWAGLSRINWVPVPLFLVVTLYFLERPWPENGKGWKYLGQPLVWGSSLIFAFIAYSAYIYLSGSATNKFSSSFTSDLLWNRLWPNSTYELGILPGILIVSAPLILVIYFRMRKRVRTLHPIKWLGFIGMLLTLFIGGLIVSVKIGGGSNLHNMDAYIVWLMTMATLLFWGRGVSDREHSESLRINPMPQWAIVFLVAVPVLLTLSVGGVVTRPDLAKDKLDLQELGTIISETAGTDGEILFISERQLLVFDQLQGVSVVPEYEKLILMEMVMAGNEDYLGQFYEDISNRRFKLIVSDALRTELREEADAFSEEHNVWVKGVIIPLLKEYQYERLGGRRDIVILKPKQ